jgi:hypothetical protein
MNRTTLAMSLLILMQCKTMATSTEREWVVQTEAIHEEQSNQKKVWWEKRVKSYEKEYMAQITSGGLIVWMLDRGKRSEIYRLEPEYNFAHVEKDLVIARFDEGSVCFGWKWCKGHDCQSRNGAVLFNPLTGQVFRLEYEEGKGLALSSNLKKPELREIRIWILDWWKQWPGWSVSENDLIYTTFEKGK